jgi:hypothetical protein
VGVAGAVGTREEAVSSHGEGHWVLTCVTRLPPFVEARVHRRPPPYFIADRFLDLQGPLSPVGFLDARDRTELLLRFGIAVLVGRHIRVLG